MTGAGRLTISLKTFSAEDPGSWAHLAEGAVAADQAGVHRLVLSDHVAMGEHLDAYGDPDRGGVAGGRQPTGPDGHWLEPLTTIAHLTALTSRVRFGTNILLAALRRPVVLAKMAATVDVLSGGRLDLGVGVGWQREEYDAAGLAFGERGRLLDESLAVCQHLWRDPVVPLNGAAVHQMPKPVQAGGVPVWVSGTVNSRSMRRLAAFGSGWIPWGADASDPARSIPLMRRAVEDAGRDPAGIAVLAPAGGRPEAAAVARLRDAGVTDVLVYAPALTAGALADLAGSFAEWWQA